MAEAAKTVRVVALDAGSEEPVPRGQRRDNRAGDATSFPTYLQALTAAQKNSSPEYITSGVTGPAANGNGLPHIYIKNYAGPS